MSLFAAVAQWIGPTGFYPVGCRFESCRPFFAVMPAEGARTPCISRFSHTYPRSGSFEVRSLGAAPSLILNPSGGELKKKRSNTPVMHVVSEVPGDPITEELFPMPKKQTEIPGTEPIAFPGIDAHIEDWRGHVSARMSASEAERTSKAAILQAMQSVRDELPKDKNGHPYYPYTDGDVTYTFILDDKLRFKKSTDSGPPPDAEIG